MNIQREIIKTIDVIVQKRIEAIVGSISYDIATTVEEVVGGKCRVTISGTTYLLEVGTGISPVANDTVWVHVPNGKITNAFILGFKSKAERTES